jgi:hypothetical protein
MDDHKARLRRLDGYLGLLETALERGRDTVNSALASHCRAEVSSIVPGMSMREAIERVFSEQETCLANSQLAFRGQRQDSSAAEPRVAIDNNTDSLHINRQTATMTESEARDVTTRIKNRVDNLALLLLRAHEGRAWMPLGYRSWERYVRAEFALSRSRSYELVDQGFVRRALQRAAKNVNVPPISARAALRLKPILTEVSGTLRVRLAAGGTNSEEVVQNVLREATARTSAGKSRRTLSPNQPSTGEQSSCDYEKPSFVRDRFDFQRLVDAVDYVTQLPPAGPLLASLSHEEFQQLVRLPVAAERVAQLSLMWSAHDTGHKPSSPDRVFANVH